MSRRLARGFAVVAAVLTMTAALAPSTSAATPDDPSRLALVFQDAFTSVGGIFHAQVQISTAGTPGLTLSVTAHQAVGSRHAFDDAAADKSLGGVLSSLPLPVDALAVNPDGSRSVAISLAAAGGLAVHLAGVYPLEMELRDARDQPVARFATFLVVVDADAAGQAQPLTARMGVSWVWPLGVRPGVRADGSVDPSVAAALEPAGRLGRQVAALGRHPTVPVTLAPTPETLDTWATQSVGRGDPGAATGAAALRGLIGPRAQALSGPYVSLDLPSLLRFGLGTAADAEFVQGAVAVDRFFGVHVDGRTALAQPVDSDALGRLRARGVDRVVVDEAAVGAQNDNRTVTAPFSLEPAPTLAPAGPVAAVASDTRLAQLLSGAGEPALRAQRFLAGLSWTATETPGTTRAVVVVNPPGFDPDTALLDAVLGGLTNHPWLTPMTLDSVFTNVPSRAGTASVRPLSPYNPPAPPVTAKSFSDTQSRLAAFASLVGPSDARVGRAERLLLSSLSADWAGPAGAAQARGQLAGVNAIVNDFVARIRVPAPGTITLTARSGEVPITFRNDTGQPIRVLVSLRSAKLDFPRGSVQTFALPPRSVTVRFDVRSRISGTFPLQMSVRSADGSLPIAEGHFKVRSTVVSTVGIALAAGAGLFLAGWWLYEIRRRRRARGGSAA